MKTRTKIRICRAMGGMERELIAVGKGVALALSCELVGAAALWKGGVLRVR